MDASYVRVNLRSNSDVHQDINPRHALISARGYTSHRRVSEAAYNTDKRQVWVQSARLS